MHGRGRVGGIKRQPVASVFRLQSPCEAGHRATTFHPWHQLGQKHSLFTSSMHELCNVIGHSQHFRCRSFNRKQIRAARGQSIPQTSHSTSLLPPKKICRYFYVPLIFLFLLNILLFTKKYAFKTDSIFYFSSKEKVC